MGAAGDTIPELVVTVGTAMAAFAAVIAVKEIQGTVAVIVMAVVGTAVVPVANVGTLVVIVRVAGTVIVETVATALTVELVVTALILELAVKQFVRDFVKLSVVAFANDV